MDTTIQAAIAGFLASLNAEHSRKSYGTPLGHFRTFLEEQGIEAEASADLLTVDHAVDFIPWLRERGYAKATFQLYLTAVQGFYGYLLDYGAEISAADSRRLERRYKIARTIRGETRPQPHTLAAAQATIQAARAVEVQDGAFKRLRELIRLRDIAIVETLRATGCRAGELVGLRVEDVDREGRAAQVHGKGDKWRKVYWDEDAWRAVLAYLRERGIGPETEAAAPLFVGHGNRSEGQPLSTRQVRRTIKELREQAGVDGVTAHYFRHVFATRALDRTGNLALVQDLLGHASPATTRVYAKTDDKQRQAAHAQVWED